MLYSIDVSLFRWINGGWSCPFLDSFFAFVTDLRHFYILLVPLVVWLLFWGKARGRWLVLSLLVALVLSDQGSSHLIKPLLQRTRPCNVLSGVRVPVGKSDAYSFPSSHASNMGSSMFLLSMAFRPWTWVFGLIALLVGLSRIYLGLHYPSDVLGGYLFGLMVGVGVWWAVEWLKSKFPTTPRGLTDSPLAAKGEGQVPYGAKGSRKNARQKR
jgi:undecaprenyl-diphosphatase